MNSPQNKDFKSHSLKNSQSIKRSKLNASEQLDKLSHEDIEDNNSISVELPHYVINDSGNDSSMNMHSNQKARVIDTSGMRQDSHRMSDLNSPLNIGTYTMISDELVSNFATSRATYNTMQQNSKQESGIKQPVKVVPLN